MAAKITKRQQAVLTCIEDCIREKGYGPTVREVCHDLGLSSPSTVHVHLKALEEKGLIKRDPLKSRSISLTYPLESFAAPLPSGNDVVQPSFSKIVNVPSSAMSPPVRQFSPRKTSRIRCRFPLTSWAMRRLSCFQFAVSR